VQHTAQVSSVLPHAQEMEYTARRSRPETMGSEASSARPHAPPRAAQFLTGAAQVSASRPLSHARRWYKVVEVFTGLGALALAFCGLGCDLYGVRETDSV